MRETDACNLLYWGNKECKQYSCLNMIQPHRATPPLPGRGGMEKESEVKKHMGF